MSPTTIARYEKEIANFKNSLTNFRKIENEKSGIINFANAFAKIKREYQRVGNQVFLKKSKTSFIIMKSDTHPLT